MNKEIKESSKITFLRRFYEPREMFLKRKYKWWQNLMFLLLFAFVATMATFSFLARPEIYNETISSSLSYYTNKIKDPEFKKALDTAKFKDGQLIYQGKKRIRKSKQFDLGINLTAADLKKSKAKSGLVFMKNKIVLYAQNGSDKSHKLESIDFSYDQDFNPHSSNLKGELERAWSKENKRAYLQMSLSTWFIGFVYRILLIWLILILIIRAIIRKVNHREESMVNLFGFLSNASAIPTILMSIVIAIYFNALLVTIIFLIALVIIVAIAWHQTRFLDEEKK
ncbi:DUF1189 family protein [Xylocopilactobacillus apicola]|uniref:DUF1189 domain-containing protein n=1 Tax=Xylocopilactobacillus apicola TaxID=2932184 RepID=A0AAU9DRR5_9LACO|nr:DUF1189 family protein [Xylocopilactobacillus apicola]BDR57878.1 hypothetical protein XA3_03190 [Xylocopilactobacillus apicola]